MSRILGSGIPLYNSEGVIPVKITTKPNKGRFEKLNKATKMTHNLTVILKNYLPLDFLPFYLPSFNPPQK